LRRRIVLRILGESGRNNIFRDPTSHVSRTAIDFARIFSGKCAAAVASHAAVAIDNNLAAGQTGVALRSANHEIAVGLTRIACSRLTFPSQNFFDHFFDHEAPDFGMFDVAGVLR